jgi:hypothetical protein
LQQATRGGVIVTENSQIHKKTLSILVKQLDALKVKHSNIKHQNRESKERVDFLRKDHFKNLKIIQDLVCIVNALLATQYYNTTSLLPATGTKPHEIANKETSTGNKDNQ